MTLNFIKGVGNQHVDVSRLLWLAGGVSAIVLATVHLVRDHQFSIIEFGTGMGLFNAGSGGATALKDTFVARAAANTPPAAGEAP